MPTMTMLVGLPGSGKSTFSKSLKGVRISTDDYIENHAYYYNKTYNELFKELYQDAVQEMNTKLHEAIDLYKDIIWDQTNLTVKSRRTKLAKIPEYYRKIAIVFDVPDDVLLTRNEKRKDIGRDIPQNVLNSMIETFDVPTKDEGFDEIYLVLGVM